MNVPTDSAGNGQLAQVVGKADEILELLRRNRELTVTEIATQVGLPRSSTHRLIATLEEIGFVEAAPDGYHLGLRLFTLGKIVASQLPILRNTEPMMRQLSESTGETIFLTVRNGMATTCMARLDGTRVQSMALNVGDHLPLHLGAGPMVLLAYADEKLVEEYLSTDLDRRTAHSTIDPVKIREELQAIRDRGYSISDEDLTTGIAAIGAPIRDAAGEVVAALSLSGARASILEPSPDAMAAKVREATMISPLVT